MAKIIGTPIATPVPKSDWKQTDPTKPDYIKNKPTIISEEGVDEKIATAIQEHNEEVDANRVYIQKENLLDLNSFEAGHFQFKYGTVNNSEGALSTYTRTKYSQSAEEGGQINIAADKVYNIALQSASSPVTYIFMYGYDANGKSVYKGYYDLKNSGTVRPILHIINGTATQKVKLWNGTKYDLVTATDITYIHIVINQTNTTKVPIMVWESDEVEKYYTEWLHLGEKPKIYYSTDKQAFTKKRDDVLLERDKARFDNSFNYIAYSRVETSAGSINTAEHFEWAAKQGFTALKGDVSPTSDGELIMCHDAGFVLTAAYDDSDGAVNYIDDSVDYDATTAKPIIELTKAQCLKIQHSVKKDYVCDFDTYIKICKKYGKIAYITIRDEHITDVVVPKMLETLDKYNMRKNCIVNSFTYSTLQTVRRFDDNIMLSQVIKGGVTLLQEHISNAINLGVCLICCTDSANNWEALTNPEWVSSTNPKETYTTVQESIKRAKYYDIRLYEALVSSADIIDTLLDYGITGAQMECVPEITGGE